MVARDLRTEQSERTREAITRAALELAVEQGFEATTVDEIASRAKVSPRTVYVRFATKDAIVIDDERFAAWLTDFEAFLDTAEGDLLDRLVTFVLRRNDQTRAQGEVAELRRRALLEDPYLRTRLRAQYDRIEAVIADDVIRELDLPARDGGARVFAAGVVVLLIEIAADSKGADAVKSRERGMRFLRAGLDALRASND